MVKNWEKFLNLNYATKVPEHEVFNKLTNWFGRVNAILIDDQTKKFYGAADQRDYGAAGGF